MKKTDIGVCAAMYLVCISFLIMTLGLPKEAQIYPVCIIVLLASLTTLQVLNMLRAAARDIESGLEEFEGFLPWQFFPVMGMIIGYLVLIYLIGFYLASVAFMVVSLAFLRVKFWQILLATGAIVALVWYAVSEFLNVRLPVGECFKDDPEAVQRALLGAWGYVKGLIGQ
ncbi:MAG: tripartite tricarboxylate transporter TctB family protein [Synergistaceae bacterium]|nr:tripartite tricarboxylate transporter TctB family protein [Synergistaceae bacterium]